MLPIEVSHINPADGDAGVRLACMTVVNRDLELTVPEDVLASRRWHCRVMRCRFVTPFLRELVLEPDAPIPFSAGDFVLVQAPAGTISYRDIPVEAPFRNDWERFRGLEATIPESTTRAYSLANRPGDDEGLSLVVRAAFPTIDR